MFVSESFDLFPFLFFKVKGGQGFFSAFPSLLFLFSFSFFSVRFCTVPFEHNSLAYPFLFKGTEEPAVEGFLFSQYLFQHEKETRSSNAVGNVATCPFSSCACHGHPMFSHGQ